MVVAVAAALLAPTPFPVLLATLLAKRSATVRATLRQTTTALSAQAAAAVLASLRVRRFLRPQPSLSLAAVVVQAGVEQPALIADGPAAAMKRHAALRRQVAGPVTK